MDWNKTLEELSVLLAAKENYQRRLGQLASGIAAEYGPQKLEELVTEIKNSTGFNISLSTIRNYRWVYDLTKDLKLPEDISYRTCQYIAASGRPEYWAKRILDEGLSSAEIFRLIRLEKGLDKKPKEVVCTNCGATNYV